VPPAIIVHGGAWDIPHALHAEHLSGCREAAGVGWDVLLSGGTAIAAVEAAIRVMEDHPVFDAGRGSHLNRDGEVELDAGIMDGATLMAGAVAGIKHIANPISLARHVLFDSEHVFLMGSGAERFAVACDMTLCENADLIVAREQEAWERRRREDAAPASGGIQPVERPGTEFQPHADTVGAVALDSAGDLAVGNSTGGTFYKHPGRVGDTPIIGCGLYADNQLGAAACTGWGEQIMKTVLAKTTVDQIALLGSAETAAKLAIAFFQRRIGGRGGVICLSPEGQVGWAHSTPNLACAYRTAEMGDVVVTLRREG
jgi:beta-aspartyl-peptidase (threonine type)